MQFSSSSRFGKLSRQVRAVLNEAKALAGMAATRDRGPEPAEGAHRFAAAEPGEEGDPALSSVENT